jgi:hypothetical protein
MITLIVLNMLILIYTNYKLFTKYNCDPFEKGFIFLLFWGITTCNFLAVLIVFIIFSIITYLP